MARNKLSPLPRFPPLSQDARPYDLDLSRFLTLQIEDINNQLNRVTEGRISAIYNAETGTPSSVVTLYAQGDFVRNKEPLELGAIGEKYVVMGWINVQTGSAVWVESRILTGN